MSSLRKPVAKQAPKSTSIVPSMYTSTNQAYGNGGAQFKRNPIRTPVKKSSIEATHNLKVKDCFDNSGASIHGPKYTEFKAAFVAKREAWV
jgi:hypothetical protein